MSEEEEKKPAFVIDKESLCGVDDTKKSKLDINQQTLRTLIVEGLRKVTRDHHRWNRCFSALQFILSHIDFSQEFRDIMKLEDMLESFASHKERVKSYQIEFMEKIRSGVGSLFVAGKWLPIDGTTFFKHDLGECKDDIDDVAISLYQRFRTAVNENQTQITSIIGGENLGEILGLKEKTEPKTKTYADTDPDRKVISSDDF